MTFLPPSSLGVLLEEPNSANAPENAEVAAPFANLPPVTFEIVCSGQDIWQQYLKSLA